MSASVVSFRSLLSRGRTQKPETVPGPWTNQELAELYRIADVLGRAGMSVGTDSGLSDENEPWFVFFSPETGDVISHFARIAGVYVAAAAGQDKPMRGTCFRDLIQQIVDGQPLVLPQERDRSGKITKLYMHPAVVLAAFVATALLCSRKTMAAADDADETVVRRSARTGDAAAAGTGGAGASTAAQFDVVISSSAVSMGAGHSLSVSFASVAALITSVLQAEEAAALASPGEDLIGQDKPMPALDSDGTVVADGPQSKASPLGAATAPDPADTLNRITVQLIQDKDFAPFLLAPASKVQPFETHSPLWAENSPGILTTPQILTGTAYEASAPKQGQPTPTLSPIKQALASSPAPVVSSDSSSKTMEKTAPPPAKEDAPAAAPQPDQFVVSVFNKDLAYITSAFMTDAEAKSTKKIVSALVKESQKTKDEGTKDGTKDTAKDKDDAATDSPKWEIPEDALKIDGLHDVALEAGRQILYFSGGTATVSGFVFGEDILLLDPSLLEEPWEGSIPADSGEAIFSFADGSTLTLSDLVFTPYDDIA